MRTMLTVCIDTTSGNKALKDGSLPKTMQAFAQEAKPEASYFYTQNGKRTAIFVFDMKDSSMMPMLIEPLFFSLNAEISLTPVMNQEELAKGLEAWSKKY